jgi:hypothetical protein
MTKTLEGGRAAAGRRKPGCGRRADGKSDSFLADVERSWISVVPGWEYKHYLFGNA